MKQIKFRAWEKNLEEIISVHNIDFDRKMINTESAWRLFDEIELNQWTGLYDKNGKEIYENDIIKYHRHLGDYYESRIVDKIGIVVWENDKCSFRIKHNGGDTEKLFTSHRIEVVGNVYEMPDWNF